jgi:hypothetical protein
VEDGMKKVLYLKGTLISIALVIVALSIAYFPVDDGKKPQECAEGNTFSLILPSFVKTAQNREKI